ncbi:VOC family protein [Kribbella sp. NPDC004536]|uniref:VOC family protein n=1 Tax=Kribbella sp. NPDC004536 TaxID=3364106 RepID=UPI0036B801C4
MDDPEEASDFYSKLFGWHVAADPVGDGYHPAWVAAEPIAAIGPKPDGVPTRSTWITVFPVHGAVPLVASVRAAGGDVLETGRTLGALGTVTIAADPVGAVFGMRSGAADALPEDAEFGLPCWTELSTRALPVALDFYRGLLGYEYGRTDEDERVSAILAVGRSPIASVRPCETDLPDAVKSTWEPHFAVPNCDRSVELALRLGAVVRSGPRDTRAGRIALLQGPQGENFTLVEHVTASRVTLLAAASSLGLEPPTRRSA